MQAIKLERRHLVAHLLCFFMVIPAGHANAQPLTPTQVERQTVGMYELDEWHLDGQILKPPVVSGRFAIHNGQIVSTYHRNLNGTKYDILSYGSYYVNEKSWSYGYEYRLEATEIAGKQSVAYSSREQVPFTYRTDGSNLVLDQPDGERRFVFGPDGFVYMEKGQIVRKWRRVKSGL